MGGGPAAPGKRVQQVRRLADDAEGIDVLLG